MVIFNCRIYIQLSGVSFLVGKHFLKGAPAGILPYLALANGSCKVPISKSDGTVYAISNISEETGINWERPWGLLKLGTGAGQESFNHASSVKLLDTRTSCRTHR